VNPPPLLVIAGPTATGKTGLAIRTALALRADGVPAEIISADSRQVYRGLDVGTAKVPVADRAGIPHHGLDLVDPDEPFSVADFVRHAREALDGIERHQGLAILAGGTGLYLRAIARGLDPDALPSDPDRRREIDAAIVADGLAPAAERLAKIAPTRAAHVDLRNPRRLSRALELAELTGDAPLPAPIAYPGPIAWIGLDVEPAIHADWIANRAREQFDSGLIEEARVLRERFDSALPAFSAIGYREAWAVLDGTLTREQAIEADAARNVAFAKRQRTWFRREPDVVWLDASSPDVDAVAAAAARRLLEGGTAEIAR
jgi:tRNA dimethylallyltransferase